ncbi:hypothetical protein V8C86DRAFT_2467004 [Haematococcus lacustris]
MCSMLLYQMMASMLAIHRWLQAAGSPSPMLSIQRPPSCKKLTWTLGITTSSIACLEMACSRTLLPQDPGPRPQALLSATPCLKTARRISARALELADLQATVTARERMTRTMAGSWQLDV